jgi:hypothetical protein
VFFPQGETEQGRIAGSGILELFGSKLQRCIVQPELGYSWFTSGYPQKCHNSSSIMPKPLYFKSVANQHLWSVLPCDDISQSLEYWQPRKLNHKQKIWWKTFLH